VKKVAKLVSVILEKQSVRVEVHQNLQQVELVTVDAPEMMTLFRTLLSTRASLVQAHPSRVPLYT